MKYDESRGASRDIYVKRFVRFATLINKQTVIGPCPGLLTEILCIKGLQNGGRSKLEVQKQFNLLPFYSRLSYKDA